MIRQRLAAHQPQQHPTGEHTRQAAVAVILRPLAKDVSVLFIKRAEKRGDPWSGHMAFPGGHRDPGDASNRAAAERETREEIGLDLSAAEYLGTLDQQRASPRGRLLDMIIEPHVYAVDEPGSLRPNYEVQEIVWSPLSPLFTNACHDTEAWPIGGGSTVFDGFRLEGGHFVWGLTYRMLKSLFVALDPQWRPADRS